MEVPSATCLDLPTNSLGVGISDTHTATPSPFCNREVTNTTESTRDQTVKGASFLYIASQDFYISMNDSYDYLLKLLIIGDANSNKEIFVNKFIGSSSAGAPTAGTTYGTVSCLIALLNYSLCTTKGLDFRLKDVQRNGRKIKLQLWWGICGPVMKVIASRA